MKDYSPTSSRPKGAALASIKMLSKLSLILGTATDLEGAFHQAAKLLEERSLRQCTGIALWNRQSNPNWALIQCGFCGNYIMKEQTRTASEQRCWTEEAFIAPRIHRKKGKDIVIRSEASLTEIENLNNVDALCLPLMIGNDMVLSMAVRPLCFDQLILREELLLLGAVCTLLKQWIELRFDPREIKGQREKQSAIASYLPNTKGNCLSMEEMLIHRIGEMVTVLATGPREGKSLYSRVIELIEKGMIRWALSRTSMVQIDAAQILGVNRNTLRAKMKLYGLLNRK
ncbi:MAG: hypothetical protein JRG73_05535 [Deltaproteobacteria bacterium]|nr:hypothetical protein [Deltaproteobacteria bacterium]MBW2306382.1 hypothetical protein [Deltaproteobacteria bacterium]